jgi:predicted TIM-barrel fold metal-dependent hydrolase
MVTKLGSEKVMMGSDLPSAVPVELTKYKTVGLTDAQIEDCLFRTATNVFQLCLGTEFAKAATLVQVENKDA